MDDVVKTKGEVFTPDHIGAYMASFIQNTAHPQKILEPSCGDGAILRHISTKHMVTGLDIQRRHIVHCRRTFSKNAQHWKFIQKDFTRFHTEERYDCIIGNPPYVKIQNMDPDTVGRMQNMYPHFIYGNTNLFVYFIARCLDLLAPGGRLIFIVPNTILYNKSMHNMKAYLLQNRLIQHIVDFRDEQVFPNATTYTCILVLTIEPNSYYTLQYGLQGKMQKIPYKMDVTSGVMPEYRTLFTPRIGLMTLADEVFIIRDHSVDPATRKIHFTKDGKSYLIEAGACKDILKVSKNIVYKIIYPYVQADGKTILNDLFPSQFPLAYRYLLDYRKRLEERDNGSTRGYPAWYAYGRTQSLVPAPAGTKRLFLPTVVRDIRGSLVVSDAPLYYAGLYLEPRKGVSQRSIRRYLIENEARILQRSNHRAGGWFSLSHGSFV